MVDIHNIKKSAIDPPSAGSIFGTATEFNNLPDTHKDQVLFLDQAASNFISGFASDAHIITGGFWAPFEKGNFKEEETFESFMGTEESEHQLKKWLYKRGIPFKTWVFVLENGNNQGLMMTWKMVVKYATRLFIMSDMVLFDSSLNWCLVYFHEDKLFFGKGNVYDASEDEAQAKTFNEKKKQFPRFKHPYL